MTALTADRATPEQLGTIQEHPVLAATKIFAGALVVLDANGYAKPAATATGLIVAGVAQAPADNSAGASGAVNVRAKAGVFRFANSAAGDAIAAAEIGDDAYIADDQTVAKTNGGGTRSVAGKIVQVDAQGVWVRVGL
jgi:hypothetical protein